jgi:hypothetical protein
MQSPNFHFYLPIYFEVFAVEFSKCFFTNISYPNTNSDLDIIDKDSKVKYS